MFSSLLIKKLFEKSTYLRLIPYVKVVQYIPHLKLKKLKRGTVLYNEGEVDTNVYIIFSGIFKAYYTDDDKKNNTLFFIPGDVMAISPLSDPPIASWVTVESLTKSYVLYFVREHYLEILAKDPFLYTLYIEATKKTILLHDQKLKNILFTSAADRYEEFKVKFKNFVSDIPQKEVASYLNITQETLSRLRNSEK